MSLFESKFLIVSCSRKIILEENEAELAETMERFEAGAEVKWKEWLFYLSVILVTGHETYRWINDRFAWHLRRGLMEAFVMALICSRRESFWRSSLDELGTKGLNHCFISMT